MKKIFDARIDDKFNWLGVNDELSQQNPSYIEKYGLLGSRTWWKFYDRGEFDIRVSRGVVSFIGEIKDEFNEIWDIVEIDLGDKKIEYDRQGFWMDGAVIVGASIEFQTVKIIWNWLGENCAYIDLSISIE
jgi:hypothetical protein